MIPQIEKRVGRIVRVHIITVYNKASMTLDEIRRKLCNQFFQTDTACVDHIAFLIDRQVLASRFDIQDLFRKNAKINTIDLA